MKGEEDGSWNKIFMEIFRSMLHFFFFFFFVFFFFIFSFFFFFFLRFSPVLDWIELILAWLERYVYSVQVSGGQSWP